MCAENERISIVINHLSSAFVGTNDFRFGYIKNKDLTDEQSLVETAANQKNKMGMEIEI